MEKIKDSEMGSFFVLGRGWLGGKLLLVIWGGNFKNYFCLFLARGPTHIYGCMYIHKTSPPHTRARASKQAKNGRDKASK